MPGVSAGGAAIRESEIHNLQICNCTSERFSQPGWRRGWFQLCCLVRHGTQRSPAGRGTRSECVLCLPCKPACSAIAAGPMSGRSCPRAEVSRPAGYATGGQALVDPGQQRVNLILRPVVHDAAHGEQVGLRQLSRKKSPATTSMRGDAIGDLPIWTLADPITWGKSNTTARRLG